MRLSNLGSGEKHRCNQGSWSHCLGPNLGATICLLLDLVGELTFQSFVFPSM